MVASASGVAPPTAGYPAPAPYWQGPAQPYVVSRATNGMAIASMVLGILWVYWVGSILALIFGYIGLRQIKERNEQGRGMAIAGVVLGWIWVGIGLIVIVIAIVRASSHSADAWGLLLRD